MKNRLVQTAIFLLLIMGMSSCQMHEEMESPAAVRIKQDIEFFCSDECYGRLPGSSGNELARDYIQQAFDEAGLIPLEGFDSFLIPYEQTIFDMENQEQMLTAVFPDGSVKTFKAGTDFYPLNDQAVKDGFSGEVTTDLSDPDLKDKIYMAHDGAYSADAVAVVRESSNGSALIIQGTAAPVLNCDSKLFEQLMGCSSLSLEGATAFRNTMVDNVVGVLPSENRNAKGALLITAHFDHVGGYGDTIYRGALDNASGTALMLEVMRQLASIGNTANYDIVFAAFNGEDMYLQGSKYLSSRLPYSIVNVINFDCIGYKQAAVLGVVGENKELQAVVISALNNGLSCVPYDDAPSSDHNSFEEQGIPAVTVSDYFGEIDIREIIHQPVDTPDILDFESIAALVNPICQYALTGELIQPKPQDQEQSKGETVVGNLYEQARKGIDAVGLSYDQVLPLEINGNIFIVRDISFLSDANTVEALITPVKLPENLGSFKLDRSASLHGSYIIKNDNDQYNVKVRMVDPNDTDYEIGVPQKITDERDETLNWHLTYTDGDVFLTLTAYDQEYTDVENMLSGGEQEPERTQIEDGMLYQRFTTLETKRILQAVCYAADDLPYYYVLYNSPNNSTAVDNDQILQIMTDIIPNLREIPKLP